MKKIMVVGGPISQKLDPVMNLVPTGKGKMAEKIADAFEDKGQEVERVGNFPGAGGEDFASLSQKVKDIQANAVIFLAHVPNVLVSSQENKIRPSADEDFTLSFKKAPKLVAEVKKHNPELLLVPFKLADPDMSVIEIVRWMLNLHAALAVYSRLGQKDDYYIIDALANEVKVKREDLPKVLADTVMKMLEAKRRRSVFVGEKKIEVKHLDAFRDFSSSLSGAFQQAHEKNVFSGRWPGNFSFRCSYGFMSERKGDSFVVTKRNISKGDLQESDFLEVSIALENGKLSYQGDGDDKPSIDSPVHRLIYEKLGWVNHIIHGHLRLYGENVYDSDIERWPCGSENEAFEIIEIAPKDFQGSYWAVNIEGHGFVILIRDEDPRKALSEIKNMRYEKVS